MKMVDDKKSQLQRFIEYNVTNWRGYDAQTPEYTGNIGVGFFRNCFGLRELMVHNDSQTYSLKAHLTHLEYQSMKPVVLNFLYLLRKAPEDYKFKFKYGNECILSPQAREKRRKGLLRRMKHLRQEREKHLRRDLECKQVVSWMFGMLDGLSRLDSIQRRFQKI